MLLNSVLCYLMYDGNAFQAVERIGRSTLKNDMVPEDLLVLSCEEDYEVCVPFLEKGLDNCAALSL